jgi:hypothetical protein
MNSRQFSQWLQMDLAERVGFEPGLLLMTRKLLILRGAPAAPAAGTVRIGYSLGTDGLD